MDAHISDLPQPKKLHLQLRDNIAIIQLATKKALCPGLWSDMANEVNVVVQVSSKLIIDAGDSATCVADELSLRHFVFDVRTRQINGEHYQRETNDVDSIYKAENTYTCTVV